jgi:hypothetical protein
MKTNVIELNVSLAPEDESLIEELHNCIRNNFPEGTPVTVTNLPVSIDDRKNHEAVGSYLFPYLQTVLTPEDYEKLGRKFGNIDGITFAELYSIGKPIPRGGGGILTQFLIDTLNSDAPVMIAVITATTAIVKQLISNYFARYDKRSLTLKHGENEITVTGYSAKDTDKIVDDFFAKVLKKHVQQSNKQSHEGRAAGSLEEETS